MHKKDADWQEIDLDPVPESKAEFAFDAPHATTGQGAEQSLEFGEEAQEQKTQQGATSLSKDAGKDVHDKSGKKQKHSQHEDNDLITVTLLKELVSLLRPKPFRKRHPILFWGGICLLAFVLWNIFTSDEGLLSPQRIAVVRIEGAIMESAPTLEWIRKLERMEHVKGILLRIDSPGGGAAASQEIHGALLHLGKTKPIVASMGGSAASGGLMVAMAAPYIVANPSTITGSIGVRMDIPQIYKLLDSIGVSQESVTSGKFKDAGSMMRALSPEDRVYFQSVVDDLKGQFVAMVADGRKKPVKEIEKIADGRVFTGQEALHLGLVDALGGQYEALAQLQELTGISPDTELLEDDNLEKMYASFMESMLSLVRILSGTEQGHAQFMFR